MGLIVPQTIKVRTSSSNCKHYREKGYEFEKCGDFIEVNVLDLPKGSGAKVKIICDVCGKKSEMCYGDVAKYNEENELITCGSNFCINKKREDTCIKKYGVKHVMQLEEVKDKIKDTCKERYKCECPLQSEEIRKKSQQTWQKNYGEGIINPGQAQEIKDRQRKTWQKNYGEDITNPFQVESVKEKSQQTWQKNYGEGIINPMQAQEVKDAMKNTCRNKYGCDYAVQSDEVQNKIKSTNNKIYGGDSPFSSEEIRKKSQQTWQKNYGEDIINPGQVEEIKNKILDSYQFNHTGPSSRAQRYINYILNGTLNKNICGSLADIYMEKENIIIEHDGSGHFLRDIINGNKTPTKEAILYEKQREDKIINNGYRMIRFIATKDRIPSDEVILNLIEGFKNSDFNVIRINFEEGTIDRDYEERWYCNFGELRKITKKDLEKFEKQEENISEN